MKKTKILLALISIFLLQQNSFAQEITLSDEDKGELQIRVKQKIEDFQMHLGTIASKAGVSETSKDAATASALELFIGRGKPYEYTDGYGNRLRHEPVQMQTSNRYRKYPPKPMTQYLKNLRNLTYTKVIIEAADAVRVDNIFETPDGKYEAIAYFIQKFCGYRDGRLVYNDIAEKKVKIYVEKEVIPTPSGTDQVIWQVLLGDIYVINTR
ncbi:MAG: hypothetical protein K2J86_04065 [Prevotella sp.]|nr:hypothetical protein [Prevotella sp.]